MTNPPNLQTSVTMFRNYSGTGFGETPQQFFKWYLNAFCEDGGGNP